MQMEDWLVWREFFPLEVRCKFEYEIVGTGKHFPHHPMLCMTCWNRWRWVWVAVWEFDKLRALIRKLRRTRAENH